MVFGRLAKSPSCEPIWEDGLQPTYQGYIKDLVIRLTGIRTVYIIILLIKKKTVQKLLWQESKYNVNFKVGDYVFLLRGRNPGKFGDHYTGPHKMLKLINKNNVKIQFKGSSKIAHANRLRISHINHEINVKKIKTKKRLLRRWITVFMFWLQMFAILFFVLLLEATTALIGYDCGSRSLNIITISLLDVGQCQMPFEYIH